MFVLAFNNTNVDDDGDDDDDDDDNPVSNTNNRVLTDAHKKNFLPRVDITNYNVLIDGRNFYHPAINNQILKSMMKLQRLQLGADPRAIQQISFYGILKTNS